MRKGPQYNQFNVQETIQSIWGEVDLDIKKSRLKDEVIKTLHLKLKSLSLIVESMHAKVMRRLIRC